MSPIAILGGGPTGLATALLLARAQVPSVVFDARPLEEAMRDARLLALSRGSLQILAPLAALPAARLAPIERVFVSSQGEFGRTVIDSAELGGERLGATMAYGDLLAALSAAVAAQPHWIRVRRPAIVKAVLQRADSVCIQAEGSEGGEFDARLALSAEGLGAARTPPAVDQVALVGEVEVDGLAASAAIERFTRQGPLALLPLPARAARPGARWMSLVWCMSPQAAEHCLAADVVAQKAALQAGLGLRIARVVSLDLRGRFPLFETARETLADRRLIYLGNSAQTLHPVAGQGFNLGLRDARELAGRIASAAAQGDDPIRAIPEYVEARRWDRRVLLAATRGLPRLFATRLAPVAWARSLGLTGFSLVPPLRAELARLLMFGVRN